MRTFYVTVPEAEAELAADRLWRLGVEGVGLHDAVDGRVELWTSVGETSASLERAVAGLDSGWQWRTEDVVEPAETWREHVEPTWYDDLGVIVPAWQTDTEQFDDDVLVTMIEPGASFGLGDHPTTELTLGLLSTHLRTTSASRVLDVGCGSGVLGIVAAQLGVQEVRSTDISSGAVEATRANALANGVDDRIAVDIAPLDEIQGIYDVVLANILAPALIQLAPDLKRLAGESGVLIVSGILDDAHDHVLEALRPMIVDRTRSKNGWISILLRSAPHF